MMLGNRPSPFQFINLPLIGFSFFKIPQYWEDECLCFQNLLKFYIRNTYVSACIYWGVAVLGLDSHPDPNKGPDYTLCACPIDPSKVKKKITWP